MYTSQRNRNPRDTWAQYQRGADVFLTSEELARRTRIIRDAQMYQGSNLQAQPAVATNGSQQSDPGSLDADAQLRYNEFLLREQRRRENEEKQRLPPVVSPDGKFETYYGHNGQLVVRILPPTSTFIDDAIECLNVKYYFREFIYRNPSAWFLILFVLMCLNWDTYVVSTLRGAVRSNVVRVLKISFFLAFWALLCVLAYDLLTEMRLTKKFGNSCGAYRFWNRCERVLVSLAETGCQKVQDTYLDRYQRVENYTLNIVENWANGVIDWVAKKKGGRMDPTTNLKVGEIFYTPVGTPAPEQTSPNEAKAKILPLTERQRLVKCFHKCGKDLITYGSIISEKTLAAVCPECAENEIQGKSTFTIPTNVANSEATNTPTAQRKNKISVKDTSAKSQNNAVAETNNMKGSSKLIVPESTISSKPRFPFDTTVVCRKIRKTRDSATKKAPPTLPETPVATKPSLGPKSPFGGPIEQDHQAQNQAIAMEEKKKDPEVKSGGNDSKALLKKVGSNRKNKSHTARTVGSNKTNGLKEDNTITKGYRNERAKKNAGIDKATSTDQSGVTAVPSAVDSGAANPLAHPATTISVESSITTTTPITRHENANLKANRDPIVHAIDNTVKTIDFGATASTVAVVVGENTVSNADATLISSSNEPVSPTAIEPTITSDKHTDAHEATLSASLSGPGSNIKETIANVEEIPPHKDDSPTENINSPQEDTISLEFIKPTSPPTEPTLYSTESPTPPITISEMNQVALLTTYATVEELTEPQAEPQAPPPTRKIKELRPLRKRFIENRTMHCPLPGEANGLFGSIPRPFIPKPMDSFQTIENTDSEEQANEECAVQATKDTEISTSNASMVNALPPVVALPPEEMTASTSRPSTHLCTEGTATNSGVTTDTAFVSQTPDITINLAVVPGVAVLSAAAGLPTESNRSMKWDEREPVAIPNSVQMETTPDVRNVHMANVQGNSEWLEHFPATSNIAFEEEIASIADNMNTFYYAAVEADMNVGGYMEGNIAGSVMDMAISDVVMTNMNAQDDSEVTIAGGTNIVDVFGDQMEIAPTEDAKKTTEQMTMITPSGNTELQAGEKDEPLNIQVACGTGRSEGHVVPTPRDKGKGKAPREDTPNVQIVPRPPFRFNRESLPETQAIYKGPQLALPSRRPPAPPAPSVRMRGPVNPLRNPRRNTPRSLPPRQTLGVAELSVGRAMEEKNMVDEIAMFADRLFGAAVSSFDDPAPVPSAPVLSAPVPSVPSPVLPTVAATNPSVASQEHLPTDEEIDNELLMLAGGWRAPSPDTSDSDWDALDESTERELAAITEAAEKAAAELMVDDAPPLQWVAPGWPLDGYSTHDQEIVGLNVTSGGPDAEAWLTKPLLEQSPIPTPRGGSPPCTTTETSTEGHVSSVTTAKDSSDEANECLFDTARMEAHQESNKYDMAVAKAAVLEADLEAISVPVPGLLNPALLPPYFHRGMDEQYHPLVSGDSYLDFLATLAPSRALIEAAQNMAAAKAAFEAGRSESAGCQEVPNSEEAQGPGTRADESSDSEEKVLSDKAIEPTTPRLNWGRSRVSGLGGPSPTVGSIPSPAYGPSQPKYFGDRPPDAGFGL